MVQIIINIILISFSASFAFLIISTKISMFFAFFGMIFSYYKIIFYKEHDIDIVLILLLFMHVVNPALAQGNSAVWSIVGYLIKYIPFIIMILKVFIYNKRLFYKRGTVFIVIYVVYSLFLSLYDFSISSQIILERLLPIGFLLLYIIFTDYEDMIDVDNIRKILRTVLLVSLVVFFLPQYTDKSRQLIESGFIYNTPIIGKEYFIIGGLRRNLGIFYDSRLLGISTYILLFIILKSKKVNFGDLILVALVGVTTFSRGFIAVTCFIIVGYIFSLTKNHKFNKKILLGIYAFFLTIFIGIGILSYTPSESIYFKFLSSLNITNEDNALTQRKILSEMAMSEFRKSPLIGNGLGWVSSDTNIVYGYNSRFTKVSDAYLQMLLCEIGIVGVFMFLIHLYVIFHANNIYNLMFLLGFCIQLIGTDVPDASIDYIPIIVLIFCITSYVGKKWRQV